nr:response regulator [Constantimarinum furrinae]
MIIILVFFTGMVHSQNETKREKKDLAIDSMRSHFKRLYFSAPDDALGFVKNAFPEYSSDDLIKAWKDHFKGTYYFNQRNADSCIFYYKKSLRNLNFEDDPMLFNENHVLLSQVYIVKREFEEALDHLKTAENAIEHHENVANNDLKINLYRAFGNYYNDNFDSKNAIDYYLKSFELLEKDGEKEQTTVNVLVNLGELFYQLKDYEQAYSYFMKGKELASTADFTFGYHVCAIRAADVNLNLDRATDSDKEAVLNAEEFFKGINALPYLVQAKSLRAKMLVESDEFEEAEDIFIEAIELSEMMKDVTSIMNLELRLADLYFELEQYAESKIHYLRAKELAERLKNDALRSQALLQLAKIEAATVNYELAYEYLNEHVKINDSLSELRQEEVVRDLEAKYKSEQQEQEIRMLTTENALAQQEQKNQRNLLWAGGILALLGLIFLYILYRNRQHTAKKVMEVERFKSRLFANISHELRTPLTLIAGYSEKRAKDSKVQQTLREEFEVINRNSQRLVTLVDQILDVSKLEAGQLKMSVSKGELSLLLRSIASSFQHIANEKEIIFDYQVSEMEESWYDKDAIEKITTNVLSNAFKYTPDGGTISMRAERSENLLLLKVENETQLDDSVQIDKWFTRFYQSDVHQSGVGIGLSLVKELVDLNRGTISASRTDHNSVVVKVSIPIDRTSYNEDELVNNIEYPTNKAIVSSEAASLLDIDKAILLVVDDNSDIRNFIASEFKSEFKIIEATNGQEALDSAVEVIPDIIILDISMPILSGIEVSKQLKSDERTSHIPIVMLTAKDDDSDKLEGLKTGADDYITKPFKIENLKVRVANLLKIREQLRERYSNEVILKPKDITLDKVDEKFLEKIQQIMDNNLTSPEFNVQEFCDLAGMSRMQLHRKLKALTGNSTSEFIRTQRLNMAASLLLNSDATISEVGYAVGFNDPSYFTKRFKDQFGISPSEYGAGSKK